MIPAIGASYETLWVSGIYRLQRTVSTCDCGRRHWRLLKLGATERVDFPILYDNGMVAFDRPEAISKRIQERVARSMRKAS